MGDISVRSLVDDSAFTFDGATTAGEAIDEIRTSSGAERTVYYAYIVDDDGCLEGVVSMRELLNADDDDTLRETRTAGVIQVVAEDPIEKAAKAITRHGFPTLPVVDENGRFEGIIQADDLIEALDEETSKDVLLYNLRDVEYNPRDHSQYECFECGELVRAADNPGPCPNCGGEMRHKMTPIE